MLETSRQVLHMHKRHLTTPSSSCFHYPIFPFRHIKYVLLQHSYGRQLENGIGEVLAQTPSTSSTDPESHEAVPALGLRDRSETLRTELLRIGTPGLRVGVQTSGIDDDGGVSRALEAADGFGLGDAFGEGESCTQIVRSMNEWK
jgi:hypothetical protein